MDIMQTIHPGPSLDPDSRRSRIHDENTVSRMQCVFVSFLFLYRNRTLFLFAIRVLEATHLARSNEFFRVIFLKLTPLGVFFKLKAKKPRGI